MKTLSITLKDLQILLKDRGALFQLFILPLLFILVFSGALSAIGQGDKEVSLPNLAVVDLDAGESAAFLVNKITREGSLAVKSISAGEAQAKLDENSVVAVLTIPQGFTKGVQQSTPVTLMVTMGKNADPQIVEAMRLVIESIAAEMTLESQIIASLQQMGEMQATAPEEYQVFSTEKVLAQARKQFETAQARPLITILQSAPQQEGSQEETPDLSLSATPGFTILFVFLAGQTTARSIYDEKKIGSFRRLASAPISKAQLLVGKLLPNFLVALIQVAVIFAFGAFGLRLMGLTPMPLGNDPFGVSLVAILLALCSTAFGVAIAALARTENQIAGISTLLLWGMGLLGGSLVPLFVLERFIGPLAMIVPHYWANKALDNLLIRGLGLADIYLSLIMLGVFSLIFFAIGLWRFDFER